MIVQTDTTNMHRILKVETGEKFRLIATHDDTYRLDENGIMWTDKDKIVSGVVVIQAVNHPETVVKVERITDEQAACLLSLHKWAGVRWMARLEDSSTNWDSLILYRTWRNPMPSVPDVLRNSLIISTSDTSYDVLSPLVKKGEKVDVEKLLRENKFRYYDEDVDDDNYYEDDENDKF